MTFAFTLPRWLHWFVPKALLVMALRCGVAEWRSKGAILIVRAERAE